MARSLLGVALGLLLVFVIGCKKETPTNAPAPEKKPEELKSPGGVAKPPKPNS